VLRCRQAVRAVTFYRVVLQCRWVGDVAQHRQRDFVNQPRDEFGRPVAGRHGDKPWHEYRPAIAAAEPARLAHPPPPGTATGTASARLAHPPPPGTGLVTAVTLLLSASLSRFFNEN